jgi:hypothetical protein
MSIEERKFANLLEKHFEQFRSTDPEMTLFDAVVFARIKSGSSVEQAIADAKRVLEARRECLTR